jgi:linoleoyl-CoA desaturase
LPLCALLGVNFASIGFNVMHDSCHGSYSSKKWVNELFGYSLDSMGASSFIWKVRHNLVHHSFTNIYGHDDDIDIQPFMRTSRDQPINKFHKYQYWYCFPLYGLTYLSWVFLVDFRYYFSRRIANKKISSISIKDHITFWGSKLFYTTMVLVIPSIVVGVIPTLIGFFIMASICGLFISVILQLAHLVEACDFPVPEEKTGNIENQWAVHQMETTTNFATSNKALSWLLGGLNFQIEHHLFPRVSHVHYNEISRIVKEVCKDFNVRYYEYKTFFQALKSHVRYLKTVGVI